MELRCILAKKAGSGMSNGFVREGTCGRQIFLDEKTNQCNSDNRMHVGMAKRSDS